MPRTPDYDHDPAALAWARKKIHAQLDQFADFERQCRERGDHAKADAWRKAHRSLSNGLLGDGNCVIGAFDERLPQFADAVNRSIPAPIDRAIRRDHSLCGAEPCSDCR